MDDLNGGGLKHLLTSHRKNALSLSAAVKSQPVTPVAFPVFGIELTDETLSTIKTAERAHR